MALSLNEIRNRAYAFVKEWEGATQERAEAQSFWNDFFRVFGVERKKVATFEEPVKLLGDRRGSIDLIWKGVLVAEHKSAGEDLEKAYSQAIGYTSGLKDYELPKYVIVSDFVQLRLYDLEDGTRADLTLKELPKRIELFSYIAGYTKKSYRDEDPVNIEAAEKVGKLHDALKENGYVGHNLEVFLVRLVFILFAEDTGIFGKGHFTWCVENKTSEDGVDLGRFLIELFEVLNTSEGERQKNLDEDLARFGYINGDLFRDPLHTPNFNSSMRNILLECCGVEWSRVSPAIFGSLFQSAMDPGERRRLGAHYTSEQNILKVINGLFLDDLKEEFKRVAKSRPKLERFHENLGNLRFLDPACGCGNFLVIAYRELRLLEIEVLKLLFPKVESVRQELIDSGIFSKINVDAFAGIEIEELPVRIAEVALWVTDHQMNMRLSQEFGFHFVRLPLITSPEIRHGNALRINWEELFPRSELSYILGNPPYVGKKRRSLDQTNDMEMVFPASGIKKYKNLDYVACWYIKAAEIVRGTEIQVAFVSTNSITQGEQVGILWPYLYQSGISINFAHRTFKWMNEARGRAAVFVVIIGFAGFERGPKALFEYETPSSEPHEIKNTSINPYLTNADIVIVKDRNKPLCPSPEILFGNMPNDGGNLLLTQEERASLIEQDPDSERFIRPLVSSKEYFDDIPRYCLWLKDVEPRYFRKVKGIRERVDRVRKYRMSSGREATKKLAAVPYLFGEIRQRESNYVLIPRHSSENREYVPFGFYSKETIVHDSCLFVPNATLYHFGVLSSAMHMAWMSQVCGRLEGRFRYSNNIVYNNYPWPKSPTGKQNKMVESMAEALLTIRNGYLRKGNSLGDLYDPSAMPKDLRIAHRKLDRAVERCYRSKTFKDELERLRFLFTLYEEYSERTPMLPRAQKKGPKKTRRRPT